MKTANKTPALLRLAFSLLFTLLALTACEQQAPSVTHTEPLKDALDDSALEHAQKHLDSKYICPMHPQIVKDEPGSCPICGMDLVEKKPQQHAESMHANSTNETPLEHAQKHLDPTYVCPMHPQIVKNEPGSCPICGMDLVKKAVQPAAPGRPAVSISNGIQQSMGIRTARVLHKDLPATISTLGRIEYDETLVVHMHPKTAGWVEQLAVRSENDPVKTGQHLADFYSPDILAAQVDYLIALNETSNYAKLKQDKARNRLRLLGVDNATIERIRKNRKTQNTIPITAAASGVITKLNAREGMYIPPQSELFTIADFSRVWVLADVYEHNLNWIHQGADAEIRVPAYPGRVWSGKVDYLYPELDAKSRTLRVRLVFDNPDGALRPNMFADTRIKGQGKSQVLTVPREAVIITGERETIIKSLDDGRFQPVDVITGMRQNGLVEIREGLSAGDEIVVSGQFLIDSESSLQASFLRISGDH